MKIAPTGNRLLVKVSKVRNYKSIALPQGTSLQGSASIGEIVAVGPGYLSDKKTDDGKSIYDATEIKIGEKIIFNMRAGLVLSSEYRLIREDEVIGKVAEMGFEIGDELFSSDD